MRWPLLKRPASPEKEKGTYLNSTKEVLHSKDPYGYRGTLPGSKMAQPELYIGYLNESPD